MVDRHDDELAERRASGERPKREAAAAAGAAGALPLEWSEPPGEDGETAEDIPVGNAEDVGPETRATTIDLTERVSRDDFAAWSDVLRRRPVEAARITSHPSAAGERLRAAAVAANARPKEALAKEVSRDDPDESARVMLDRRRRRGGRDRSSDGAPSASPRREEAAANVSRLPVWSEPEGPAGPSGFGADLVTRVVTGVVVAAACLLTLNAGRAPAAWLCALIIGLGTLEMCTALRSQGYRPAVPIALAGSVGLVLGAYVSGQSAYPLVLFLVLAATLLWHLAQVVRGRPVMGTAMTLLAFGYVGGLGGFAGLLLGFDNGVGMLVGLAICTVSYDVVGYAAGRRFGRRPLTAVSPNKTVEGLLAGMLGSMVLSVVIVGSITPWDRLSALALGAAVAVLAPLGDLCESMLKRDLGVKDLGGILPGHGGVLDRFDAILFALPAVYYLVRILELN